jgi:MFS family permease
MLFFASAAASPLDRVYQAQFHFSAVTLTGVFAVYVLVLLVTLLFFGSVSDYLGRLPVIITALIFSAVGCGLPGRAWRRGTVCGPVHAGHRDRPGQWADRRRAD